MKFAVGAKVTKNWSAYSRLRPSIEVISTFLLYLFLLIFYLPQWAAHFDDDPLYDEGALLWNRRGFSSHKRPGNNRSFAAKGGK